MSTSDVERRCVVCGEPIRVIAFLADDTCSVDCAKEYDNEKNRTP